MLLPIFSLTCVRSDYPQHLAPGVTYKVNLNEKHGQELMTYWWSPVERQWVNIGLFPMTCFDTTPVRTWLAERKGQAQPKIRQRPEIKIRQRPVII